MKERSVNANEINLIKFFEMKIEFELKSILFSRERIVLFAGSKETESWPKRPLCFSKTYKKGGKRPNEWL